jgi:hypothetical protein
MKRIIVLALALGLSCRKQAVASPEFTKAQDQFNALYAQKLDGAYNDPAVEEVLALLAKVPPESPDAAGAAELKARIEAGRKGLAEEERRRQEMMRVAANTGGFVSAEGGGGGGGGGAEGAADGGEDGGAAEGQAAEDFETAHKGCVQKGLGFQVQGSDVKGDAWELVASDACKAKFPALVGKRVYVAGGKVYRIEEAEKGKVVEWTGDPNKPPVPTAAPDAGEQDGGAPDAAP